MRTVKLLLLILWSVAQGEEPTCSPEDSGDCHDKPPICIKQPWASLGKLYQRYYSDDWTPEEWDADLNIWLDQDNTDILWEHLCEDYKNLLKTEGWTEEKWDKYEPNDDDEEDDDDDDEDEDEEEQERHERAEYLRKVWFSWNRDLRKPVPEFAPRVIKVDIPEIQAYNIDYMATLDMNVDLVPSRKYGESTDSELWREDRKTMSMENIVAAIKSGKAADGVYFQAEHEEQFVQLFPEGFREKVINAAKRTLVEQGVDDFKQKLRDLPPTHYDLGIFFGAKDTATPSHIDMELFNFLYVVEGRKRVYMLPYDPEKNLPSEIFYESAWSPVNIIDDPPEGVVVMEVEAEEGILIPYRCYHAVENLDHTLAYAFRVYDPRQVKMRELRVGDS